MSLTETLKPLLLKSDPKVSKADGLKIKSEQLQMLLFLMQLQSELLGWLDKQQANGTSLTQPSRTSRRKRKTRHSMKELMAWYDSIRGTTDWQPPRMPDDLVKPVRL